MVGELGPILLMSLLLSRQHGAGRQVLLALAFVAVARGGFTGGLLVVVAGEAPFVWGMAPALGVVALHHAVRRPTES